MEDEIIKLEEELKEEEISIISKKIRLILKLSIFAAISITTTIITILAML